jgi:hypothetical protein
MDHDSPDPSFQRAFPSERIQPGVNPDKSFLEYVLCIVLVRGVPQANTVHRSRIPLIEHSLRLYVLFTASLDQFGFGHLGNHAHAIKVEFASSLLSDERELKMVAPTKKYF